MQNQNEQELKNKITALTKDISTLENYNKDLFSFSPLSICFVSPEGLVLEANPAFEKFFGKELDEVIGEKIDKFFDKERIEQYLAEAKRAEFSTGGEIFFKNSNGENVLVNLSGKARRGENKELIGYFIGVFDLTGIKKNEIELRDAKTALLNILEDTEEARKKIQEEKEKTSAVIANLTDGLIVLDYDNIVSLVNPKALLIFDVDQKELVNKSLKDLSQNPNLKSLIKILGFDQREIFREELKLKDNLILDVSMTDITRENDNHERVRMGSLVVLHDITREKIIEKMKTEFVSISAHQLRTPLSAIKWTLQLLLTGDLGKITAEQRDFIEKINISNERMIYLINDLLNVARIEEGRYIYDLELCDIGELVRSVVQSYNDGAKRKKIKLELEMPQKRISKIKVDTEKINLAISNLVDNAIKYTPESGQVKVSLIKNDREVQISVKDTGIGIPDNQKERMFGKFFRASNAMKKQTEGSGLGDFIVKNIIEAHGGKVWFDSKENKGATFYCTIPIKN